MGTKKQNMMIGYLLQRLGVDEETKEDTIFAYTDGRTTSISKMDVAEAAQLINRLVKESALPPSDDMKMRRKILSMAHEMHWEIAGSRVDMARVNNWCVRYSGYSKPLDELSHMELVSAVTRFEMAYKDFLKGI